MRVQHRLAAVLAIAILFLVAAAALLLEREGAVPSSTISGAAETHSLIEPAPSASDRDAPASARIAPPTEGAPQFDPPARAAVEDERGGVDLRLVDAMTKKPRDDAAAWYINPGDESAADRSALWRQSDLLVERCGVELDVDGEAHVRLPDLAAVEIVARARDRFARATILRSNGEHQKLELLPDAPLTVRVVDAEGRRCGGMPVVLHVVSLNDEGAERTRGLILSSENLDAKRFHLLMEAAQRLARVEEEGLWRGTTSNAEGEAIVPHGAELLVTWSDPDLVVRGNALRFRLALPTSDDATALVDPQMDFRQPVVLVAPALVKLLVALVGPDGQPYPYEVALTTRLAPRDEPGSKERSATPGTAGARSVEEKASSPLLRRLGPNEDSRPKGSAVSTSAEPVEMVVPAGARIEIEADPADARFKTSRTTVSAPVEAGASESVTIKLEQVSTRVGRSPRVLGRILDPDGRPLADERIGWETVDPYRRELVPLPARSDRADHQGRFVMPMPSPVQGRRTVTVCAFAPCPRPETGFTPTMSALVELGDADRRSDLEVGDVQLRRLPLLLAGRVVDPEGHGLPHPNLRIWADSTPENYPPDTTFVAGRSGAFTIASDTGERSIRLAAELDGWYTPDTTIDRRGAPVVPTMRVAAGTSDLTIVLHRCGSATGELLLDPSVEPSAIQLETSPHAPAVKIVREEGTRFRLVGLPGLCDLSVLGSGHSLLTLIDRIELREAVPTDDPRIQPLDCTGVVRMPLQVVDPGGAPIPGASLALSSVADRSRRTQPFRADPFGREVIVALQNDAPLFVVAPGFRLQRVLLESREKRVTLAAGIHVTFTVQGLGEALSDTFVTLSASFTPDRSTPPAVAILMEGDRLWSASVPAKDARIEQFFSVPGPYFLGLMLTDRAHPSTHFLTSEPAFVEIVDTDDAQNVTLRLSEQSLRRALDWLGR